MKKVTIEKSDKEYYVGKIVCVGKNYLEHSKELGDAIPEKPVLFMKPPSVIIYSGEDIIYPEFTTSLHHEVELVLLIGKNGKKINSANALDYIDGYAVGLDLTLRDFQTKLKQAGHPWEISKCFDTSAVLGNFVSKNEIDNPNNLDIKLFVNGQLRQDDNTSNMIFNVQQIIEYVSFYFSLQEGDLIFTGTPKGVGEIVRGDKLEAFCGDKMKLETKVV